MGLAYLFALVVGLGTLLMQIAMGAKGSSDAHGDTDAHGDAEADDFGEGHDAHGGGKDVKHVEGDTGIIALFFSTRFWIFASLAFGMSGGLIHLWSLAGPITTALIAAASGFASGLFAVLVFQAVKRASNTTTAHSTDAVGQVGRVLVTCRKGKTGKVRVELRGHSVDMLATTDDDEIARGELILVEDVEGHTLRVSRRPPELE